MADVFKFELVSPERLLVSEDVLEVVVPGQEGYFTVLAQHAPVMATLQPGVVEVKNASGAEERYCVFGGFVDIVPDSCTLLAESAVNVKDVDRADVEQRIADARDDVNDAKDDDSRAKAQTYLDQLTTLQNQQGFTDRPATDLQLTRNSQLLNTIPGQHVTANNLVGKMLGNLLRQAFLGFEAHRAPTTSCLTIMA